MSARGVDILMYHSISDGDGPTCVSPGTFRQQMAALEERGYRTVSLANVTAWLRRQGTLPPRAVVLTFDDGYEDFVTTAYPELYVRGWTATVFLPAAKVGRWADWDTVAGRGRRLLSWQAVAELASLGIDFGAHSVSHVDLTRLPAAAVRDEVVHSKRRIEEWTERPVAAFAAPFGRTNPTVLAEIRQHYQVAVSTELARVRPGADPHHLPRIEMWYFRDPRRWRSYLDGGARGYFLLRQTLRRVRTLVDPGR